jgi:predicted MFS family arabinose efflux permease
MHPMTLFLVVERRVPEPALPLRLFRIRTFNIASAVSFIIGITMFGSITYLPTFLQVANGASASNSGLLLVPIMGGLLAASIIAGRISTRTGRYRRFPVIGMGVTVVGMLLSTLGTGSSRWESGLYMALLGAGIGMVMQIIILATQNEAPVADLGVATSTVTFFRAVGGSVGVALFGGPVQLAADPPARRRGAHRHDARGHRPPADRRPGTDGRRVRRRHHHGVPLRRARAGGRLPAHLAVRGEAATHRFGRDAT